ncbi:hypothetical protein BJX65DRAFT_313409 [Aspergillus insuetus]
MPSLLSTMVQAAVSKKLYKEVYDLSVDFPISESPRYKPRTIKDPETSTGIDTEPPKPHDYPPESTDKKDLMRTYWELPPARNEQPVKPLRGLNKEARGWYCFLGQIISVSRPDDDSENWLVWAFDSDSFMVPIVFDVTDVNDDLLDNIEDDIQPGNSIMVLLAKRTRLGGEEGQQCIMVENPGEVKFLKTYPHDILALGQSIFDAYRTTDEHGRRQCFSCQLLKDPHELTLCQGCWMFFFCDKPANDRTNCHRFALLFHDHANLCSLLRDPDLQLIYSGRYQSIDWFNFPVVRHNYL